MLPLASIFLVVLSGISICLSKWWLGMFCIAIADIYLVVVLGLAAFRSDKLAAFRRDKSAKPEIYVVPDWMDKVFPTRLAGCIVVVSLLATLILGFASLYIALNSSEPLLNPFNSSIDAIYFSYVTITTLGYGDFSPVSDCAKYVVLFQLSSGILLLFGVFPLLISRISDFTSDK